MKLFRGRHSQKAARGFSIIDDRLTIRGEIETDGTVRVDGRVEGPVHRAATLIIGVGGGIVGDVEAGDVLVAGTIHGNVHAAGRIEIEPGAAVHGEIRANAMLLHEGAMIHGQVSIGAAPASAGAATSGARRLELAQTPATVARLRV